MGRAYDTLMEPILLGLNILRNVFCQKLKTELHKEKIPSFPPKQYTEDESWFQDRYSAIPDT